MTERQKHIKDIEKRGGVPWIGVDLDRTLAEYHNWGEPIGKPILPMLTRVYRWKADGVKIKIFTARCCDAEGNVRKDQVKEIKAWLEPLGLEDLEITNRKDNWMLEFWDDRAVQVIPNTGERADGKYQRD